MDVKYLNALKRILAIANCVTEAGGREIIYDDCGNTYECFDSENWVKTGETRLYGTEALLANIPVIVKALINEAEDTRKRLDKLNITVNSF